MLLFSTGANPRAANEFRCRSACIAPCGRDRSIAAKYCEPGRNTELTLNDDAAIRISGLLCPRVLRSDHQLNVRQEEPRGFRSLGVDDNSSRLIGKPRSLLAVTAVGSLASREAQRRTLECSVRQQSLFQLQLFSASLILRRPRLSIEAPTSIARRTCLARRPINFARHLHLVRRYARTVGRGVNNANAERLNSRTRFCPLRAPTGKCNRAQP
jgi:hypothetical protein